MPLPAQYKMTAKTVCNRNLCDTDPILYLAELADGNVT